MNILSTILGIILGIFLIFLSTVGLIVTLFYIASAILSVKKTIKKHINEKRILKHKVDEYYNKVFEH